MLSTIIIGGGPGGLGPLIWAAQQGPLPSWLDRGLAIVDRQDHLGGTLGRFGINSDSLGGSYLECLDAPGLPRRLRRLRLDPVTHEMARYRDGFPPLALVDRYMRRLGDGIEAIVRSHGNARYLPCTAVTALRLQRDGSVEAELRAADGERGTLAARTAIVALGGRQNWPEPPLLFDLTMAECLMTSDRLLSLAGLVEATSILATIGARRIMILGGSHSAYSAAWALLQLPGAGRLRPGQIVILQRQAPPVFYPDREAAEADLYPVTPGDICPRTGRVNRLGGLRGNGRDLWRQMERRPGTTPELRVAAIPLQSMDAESLRDMIERAALVVPAFGYRAASLPVFDAQDRRLPLSADCGGASVDDQCRMMLADGSVLPNVFGIGLGSGFRPTGGMGGEPNFRGQANSLWLYQHDIGSVIYRAIHEIAQPAAPALGVASD
jgi:hypothetical protein